MADPAHAVLGGLVIAFVSGGVGAVIGGWRKISDVRCDERRSSCFGLVVEKLDHFNDKLDKVSADLKDLTKKVNGKLLGL